MVANEKLGDARHITYCVWLKPVCGKIGTRYQQFEFRRRGKLARVGGESKRARMHEGIDGREGITGVLRDLNLDGGGRLWGWYPGAAGINSNSNSC